MKETKESVKLFKDVLQFFRLAEFDAEQKIGD
jgi:hypothetical protein